MPELARQVLEFLAAQLDEVGQRIAEVDARITAWHKANPVSRRFATIPGIGPLIATAIAATVPDPDIFRVLGAGEHDPGATCQGLGGGAAPRPP